MERHNASGRFVANDENQRAPNMVPQQPEKCDKLSQQTVPTRQALADLSSNRSSDPSPKEDDCNQEGDPVTRSMRPGSSFENSLSLSDFDLLEEPSDNAPTENAEADAYNGPCPASTHYATCKRDDVRLVSTGSTENTTAQSPVPQQHVPDCQGAEGVSSGVLDATIRAADTMGYTAVRGKESRKGYRRDIYNYLRNREQVLHPDPGYMCKQPHISSYMRSDLVDWLVDFCEEHNLGSEKLFLAVSYVDRFLSRMAVRRDCLQLVGAAALFLSSKVDSVDAPPLSEFLRATADFYTKKELLWMEGQVLEALSYDMCGPTIGDFLQRFVHVGKAPVSVAFLSQYYCELALLDDHPCLRFFPSIIAAAALCLANHTLSRNPWGPALVEHSGYDVTHLQECLQCLHVIISGAPSRSRRAVILKYNTSKYKYIASVKPSATLPS